MRLVGGLLTIAAVAGCSGGRDKLIAELQASRPEDRATAVRKLAEKFNNDDLGLFSQAARDPVPVVRAEAMTALARSADARVVDLLGEGLGDSDESVQLAAAKGLATLRTEKARAYLTLQYGRRGRDTRAAIVDGLKAANVPGALASVIAAEASTLWERNLKSLQSGSLPERAGAAELLGKSGRPEAVNRLVPLLKDPQVVLAAAAARGLGQARDVRAVPGLLAVLKENYPELREAACEALAQLKDPQALNGLADVAREHSPSSVLATQAIAALPASADTDKILCEIAQQGPSNEAMAAARELRHRSGCPVDPLLEKLKNPATQLSALTALSGLGAFNASNIARVVPLLTSTDASVRAAAVTAITDVADPSSAQAIQKAWEAELKALAPLKVDWVTTPLPKLYEKGFDPAQALESDDPEVKVRKQTADLLNKVDALRARQAKATGKSGVEVHAPSEVVDDASEEQLKVFAALVKAVGVFKVEGLTATLEALTHESSPSVRGAAWAALIAQGDAAIDRSVEGLFDADRQVQTQTAQALAASGAHGANVLVDAVLKMSGDRSRLFEALRAHPIPAEAAKRLVPLIQEGSSDAGLVAQILAAAGASDLAPTIVAKLDDAAGPSHREFLEALGQMKNPAAIPSVARELFSDSEDVRLVAIRALQGLQANQHIETLEALKGDYFVTVRETAAQALGALNPEAKH